MKYDGLIMAARKYMHPPDDGEFICSSCGRACTDTPFKKALKTNFTNYSALLISGGTKVCKACLSLLDDKDLRFKPVIYRVPGIKEILNREDVLNVLKKPPDEYVLSVPYSFKKHHWLYAGLSSQKLALIGTDSRTVVIDYTHSNTPEIIGSESGNKGGKVFCIYPE